MIRIHRVYTRKGDAGFTRLAGGKAVSKDAWPLECFGALDELRAWLGFLSHALRHAARHRKFCRETSNRLQTIQQALFDLGHVFASPPAKWPEISLEHLDMEVRAMESDMDQWTVELPALTSFILAGGGELSSLAHIARTQCRRAERLAVTFYRKHHCPVMVITYLNRLSDYFFVLGRMFARRFREPEILWTGPTRMARVAAKKRSRDKA